MIHPSKFSSVAKESFVSRNSLELRVCLSDRDWPGKPKAWEPEFKSSVFTEKPDMAEHACNRSIAEQRQVNPRSSWVCQPSLNKKLRDPERPCLEEMRWRGRYPMPCSGLHKWVLVHTRNHMLTCMNCWCTKEFHNNPEWNITKVYLFGDKLIKKIRICSLLCVLGTRTESSSQEP